MLRGIGELEALVADDPLAQQEGRNAALQERLCLECSRRPTRRPMDEGENAPVGREHRTRDGHFFALRKPGDFVFGGRAGHQAGRPHQLATRAGEPARVADASSTTGGCRDVPQHVCDGVCTLEGELHVQGRGRDRVPVGVHVRFSVDVGLGIGPRGNETPSFQVAVVELEAAPVGDGREARHEGELNPKLGGFRRNGPHKLVDGPFDMVAVDEVRVTVDADGHRRVSALGVLDVAGQPFEGRPEPTLTTDERKRRAALAGRLEGSVGRDDVSGLTDVRPRSGHAPAREDEVVRGLRRRSARAGLDRAGV